MTSKATAQMGGLREIAAKIIADYKQHYDFPPQGESYMEDCIMDALESVRSEALEGFSVHHDFDLERITLAMVEAVDDEYACNEKLRIAYAHDVGYRRRTIAAVHQRLLNDWIDLVIKPLLAMHEMPLFNHKSS